MQIIIFFFVFILVANHGYSESIKEKLRRGLDEEKTQNSTTANIKKKKLDKEVPIKSIDIEEKEAAMEKNAKSSRTVCCLMVSVFREG